MLEDVEQSIAAGQAEAEGKPEEEPAKTPVRRKRQVNRGALPKHLPREDVVLDVADKSCPCCKGLRVKIGEDVSERLDMMIPARFKVIVTRRPIYACRACEGEVVQAPAAEHLIEAGIPTENLVAAVVKRQIRRPSAALPAGADLWPPGHRTRSLDFCRLVGPRRLRAAARL